MEIKTLVEPLLEQLASSALQIHQAHDLAEALEAVVRGARALLQCDRILVYRLLPSGDGLVLSESVNQSWQPLQGQLICEPCFSSKWHRPYQQGRISVIEDVYTNALSPCHIKFLAQMQVRANLVVPILLPARQASATSHRSFQAELPELWGLLIAHQCSSGRRWQPIDQQTLKYFAVQMGLAISQLPQLSNPGSQVKQLSSKTGQASQSDCDNPHRLPRSSSLDSEVERTAEVDLSAFDLLQSPIWVYDIENLQMYWANQAALPLWDAESREALLNRDFSDVSEATHIRLRAYLHQFQQGKRLTEQWTFYPGGHPVSVQCHCSGIRIESGRLAMLVEGRVEAAHQVDQATLRSLEALRHTTLMISLYTLSGVPLMQNPAALNCYGDMLHPQAETHNAFLHHFVEPQVGEEALAAVKLGQVFSTEARVITTDGVRWHGLDVRRVADPVTGNALMLVNEKNITDRKQTEAKLEEQQAFLRQILDAVPSSIFVKDKDGRLLVVNQANSTIHGSPADVMLGQREPDFNPNFDNSQLEQFLAVNNEVMETRQPHKSIQLIVTADGEIRWHQTVIRPFIDTSDEVQGIIGNSIDITEIKQVEATLRQTSQQLAAIVGTQQEIAMSNPDLDEVMALVVSRTQHLTNAYGAVIELLDGDELVYRAASGIAKAQEGLRLKVTGSLSGYCLEAGEILQCDDVETDTRVDLAACRQIGLRSMLLVPLVYQGERIGVLKVLSKQTNAFCEKDVQTLQLLAGFLAATLRLTLEFEAKNMLLNALQESENRYRSVIAALTEGIILQQADGQITACNPNAERILGLTADQLRNLPSVDLHWQTIRENGSLFPGKDHPAMVTLRTGKSQSNVVMGLRKTSGMVTWISINAHPLFHPGQALPYAVVMSFADITPLKNTTAILQQQAERERMSHTIAQSIRQSLDLEQVLKTAVSEIRRFLQTDRVVIYRLNPDWSGTIVTESVASDQISILNRQIIDTYFVEKQEQAYEALTIRVTPDIYTAGFHPCHIELLEKLQVRSQVVVPIWQEARLWGLLIAHQCHSPREWQDLESDLLIQLATQLSIAIQQAELYQRLQTANVDLEQLATLDGLTQIANRRSFEQHLTQEWDRLKREQQPLSLILIDVDYFKRYNDTYGHLAGDDCLRQVAQTIRQAIRRPADLAARYGGEEFVVLLPSTGVEGATRVAKAIQTAIQQLQIQHEASSVSAYITVSLGIGTTIPSEKYWPEALVAIADEALYEAKSRGRNTHSFRSLGPYVE